MGQAHYSVLQERKDTGTLSEKADRIAIIGRRK
jgi:hypothetical protein